MKQKKILLSKTLTSPHSKILPYILQSNENTRNSTFIQYLHFILLLREMKKTSAFLLLYKERNLTTCFFDWKGKGRSSNRGEMEMIVAGKTCFQWNRKSILKNHGTHSLDPLGWEGEDLTIAFPYFNNCTIQKFRYHLCSKDRAPRLRGKEEGELSLSTQCSLFLFSRTFTNSLISHSRYEFNVIEGV